MNYFFLDDTLIFDLSLQNCVLFCINNITFSFNRALLILRQLRVFFSLRLKLKPQLPLLESSRIAPSFAGLLRSLNTIAEVREAGVRAGEKSGPLPAAIPLASPKTSPWVH